MGNMSGVAPEPLNILVSIIPGWTPQKNMLGFSAARNSRVLICASFERRYPKSSMTCFGGRQMAPAVTANTTARVELAVEKKAFAAITVDLTWV